MNFKYTQHSSYIICTQVVFMLNFKKYFFLGDAAQDWVILPVNLTCHPQIIKNIKWKHILKKKKKNTANLPCPSNYEDLETPVKYFCLFLYFSAVLISQCQQFRVVVVVAAKHLKKLINKECLGVFFLNIRTNGG